VQNTISKALGRVNPLQLHLKPSYHENRSLHRGTGQVHSAHKSLSFWLLQGNKKLFVRATHRPAQHKAKHTKQDMTSHWLNSNRCEAQSAAAHGTARPGRRLRRQATAQSNKNNLLMNNNPSLMIVAETPTVTVGRAK
jgi:hypothetical protein